MFVNNKASVGRKTTPVTKKAGKRRPAKKIHVPRTPNSEEHGLVGKVDLVCEMVCWLPFSCSLSRMLTVLKIQRCRAGKVVDFKFLEKFAPLVGEEVKEAAVISEEIVQSVKEMVVGEDQSGEAVITEAEEVVEEAEVKEDSEKGIAAVEAQIILVRI